MKITGHLRKMETSLESPVQYHLPLDDERILLNDYIGQLISLTYTGEIHCIECGRRTNKSYSQGFCYPCCQSLPQCDICIMKPELCHYDKGTCRDPAWGEQFCMQDHYVYLANSSGIKVGITRGTQIPTRWIDQGASQALPVFKVSTRLTSGKVEIAMKKHVSDRTDWRKMLKGKPESVDLLAKRDELVSAIDADLKNIIAQMGESSVTVIDDQDVVELEYPVNTYPEKVKSFNFDKTPTISGVLQGIKGQYLILDTGVLNIRKFAGYKVTFE